MQVLTHNSVPAEQANLFPAEQRNGLPGERRNSALIRSKRHADLLKRTAPLGIAGGLVGLAAFIEPGVIVGSVFLGVELLLGGLGLYKLWPKK